MRRALERAPGSIRELARATGVSERLLRLIRDGERRATPAVVAKLAEALEHWGDACLHAARSLRDSLGEEDA